MASENAERFMNALQELEQTGNLDPLVEQFSQDAELRRLSGEEPARGPEGTRKFWKEYLAALEYIHTKFKHIIEEGDTIVLEWVTEVDPETGRPFTYEGVRSSSQGITISESYYGYIAFLPCCENAVRWDTFRWATEKGQRDAALKLVATQDYSLVEKYRSFNPTG
jgi:hypothetical protein